MSEFDALIEGYRRFRVGQYREQRERYDKLAQGQDPKVMVIACSDSRVDPAQVFDTSPGEIFVVRNVANLVPPFELGGHRHGVSAALEFAVTQLQVSEIVVMGHALCGGAGALIDGTPEAAQDFLPYWISIGAPARDIALQLSDDPVERRRIIEHQCVHLSLRNLETFPWIKERLEDGRLELHGAYFAVATGVLERLRPDGTFTAA